jgi:regulator of cell morphogenesis and NO signaling
MLHKVVSRHGDRLSDVLVPLQEIFSTLHIKLAAQVAREDGVLFPAIAALDAAHVAADPGNWDWIEQSIEATDVEHAEAGQALARMASLTGGFSPPVNACPTFRGLYHGLQELEREMHLHAHIENHMLFPRTLKLLDVRRARTGQEAS